MCGLVLFRSQAGGRDAIAWLCPLRSTPVRKPANASNTGPASCGVDTALCPPMSPGMLIEKPAAGFKVLSIARRQFELLVSRQTFRVRNHLCGRGRFGSCRNDVEISEGQCLRMLLAECAWPIAVDGVPASLKVLYSIRAAPPPGTDAVHGLLWQRRGS